MPRKPETPLYISPFLDDQDGHAQRGYLKKVTSGLSGYVPRGNPPHGESLY